MAGKNQPIPLKRRPCAQKAANSNVASAKNATARCRTCQTQLARLFYQTADMEEALKKIRNKLRQEE